jgi:hypothetical protein
VTRDYRDDVIEALADTEASLRAQCRLERAFLLDRIDALAAENKRLRDQLSWRRDELRRYTAAAITGRRVA